MSFVERMKQTIAKGYENASSLLTDAAEKAKELGEKGILEYEIKKLEKEVENLMPVLGSEIYAMYSEKKLKILDEADDVQKILTDIRTKEDLINKKEETLSRLKEEHEKGDG
ncbi:MAG: hypothetical protein JW881_01260 [Spirochaetales bacterium]|nr:hypothetical protein [Spirochaetales bacterium]